MKRSTCRRKERQLHSTKDALFIRNKHTVDVGPSTIIILVGSSFASVHIHQLSMSSPAPGKCGKD